MANKIVKIPSLASIYKGYSRPSTTAQDMIEWVQRVADKEYGVPTTTLLSWAHRDRQAFLATADHADMMGPQSTQQYWQHAIDSLLARNQWEDLRTPADWSDA